MPGAVREVLRGDNVGLTDYQVLLDFDGALGGRRTTKRAEAAMTHGVEELNEIMQWSKEITGEEPEGLAGPEEA